MKFPFGKKKDIYVQRKIDFDDRDTNSLQKFPDNYVTTGKYRWWNFPVMNLIEQFMRLANLYFLLISILQQIPNLSPTGKYTTLMPLAFVLLVTMFKEGYEDYKRHQQDKEVNLRSTQVFKDGQFEATNWRDIVVGDLVKVNNRSPFPADLVIIASSGPQGMCYIETANLDGETNLKIRQTHPDLRAETEIAATQFQGVIKCEGPNNRLYTFDGTYVGPSYQAALDNKQMLLRGAVLRNTSWIIGIVVYSGHETKLMMNSSAAPVKRTQVERITNSQIVLVFALLCVLAVISAAGSLAWQDTWESQATYLDFSSTSFLRQFGTFLILFNNLIPISLYVSMEVVKIFQAMLINSDLKMYHTETDTPALARTSNLNEELGQVEYIFSDKTGTLTENLMEFRKCSIGGVSFGFGTTEIGRAAAKRQDAENAKKKRTDMMSRGNSSSDLVAAEAGSSPPAGEEESEASVMARLGIDDGDVGGFNDPRLLGQANDPNHVNSERVREFLTCLAVCHTVIPETDPDSGDVVYQAASPDEGALVEAAQTLGYDFRARTAKNVTIHVNGVVRSFEVLAILEFDSFRRRMSAVVRTPNGQIILYTKGADSVITDLLAPGQEFLERTNGHLNRFANEGLRTLMMAKRELSDQEFKDWFQKFHAARVSVTDRKKKVDAAAALIEQNLELIGASAIEDKLQKGVPDTIATLASAGIKLWVLTGDKQETAINIGYACALLNDNMSLMILNRATEEELNAELDRRLEEVADRATMDNTDELALLIDGDSLEWALKPGLREKLLKLAMNCVSVICCRVSPLQKAMVVSLVKNNLSTVTLAIGDGANDVSMIQAAHVGIGISGNEGLQAARSSDYSIAQFRYLKRLLLIHGRYSYRRISKLVLYSFYKNITLYLTQLWFTFHNGFSGQTLYEPWTVSVYNVIFTSLPIMALGIFDQDIGISVAEEFPQLYIPGSKHIHFNLKVFWQWVATAISHSLICLFLGFGIFDNGVIDSSARVHDLWSVGTTIYTAVVFVVTLKVALEMRYWTFWSHLVIWGSILSWFLYLMVYCTFFSFTSIAPEMYYTFYNLAGSSVYWFAVVLIVVAALFRDFTWKFLKRTYRPQPYHIIQEVAYLRQKVTPSLFKDAGRASLFLTSLQRHHHHGFDHGFAFSDADQQSNLVADAANAANDELEA